MLIRGQLLEIKSAYRNILQALNRLQQVQLSVNLICVQALVYTGKGSTGLGNRWWEHLALSNDQSWPGNLQNQSGLSELSLMVYGVDFPVHYAEYFANESGASPDSYEYLQEWMGGYAYGKGILLDMLYTDFKDALDCGPNSEDCLDSNAIVLSLSLPIETSSNYDQNRYELEEADIALAAMAIFQESSGGQFGQAHDHMIAWTVYNVLSRERLAGREDAYDLAVGMWSPYGNGLIGWLGGAQIGALTADDILTGDQTLRNTTWQTAEVVEAYERAYEVARQVFDSYSNPQQADPTNRATMERVVGYGSPGNVTTIQAPVVRQGDVSTESTMEDAWSNYISRLCREYYTYSTLEGGVITIRGGVADDLRTLGHFLRVDEHGNVTIVPTQFSRHATDLSGR